MSTALYRRYRSARFGDLIGQDHIARTLQNEVRRNSMAHAYLFTGIRGTGKTSTARILARAVNCLDPKDGEPCNECQACRDILQGTTVDVLEIDAASNRGIDEMRDLREKVKFLPASLQRKVYIIDEAHMLTTEAWNAFLKTLEEPPNHVLFVLATTEPHKVPETVRSRVQRFDFRRVEAADIAKHLRSIGTQEEVEIEADAIELLARAAQGSVRDALSLLDQALASGDRPLTLASVRTALGLADPQTVRDLLSAIAKSEVGTALRAANDALSAGSDPRQLLSELSRLIRGVTLILVKYPEGADLTGDDRTFCDSLAAENSDTNWWVTSLERLAETEIALRQPIDARLQIEYTLLRVAQPATPTVEVVAQPQPVAKPIPAVQPPMPAPPIATPAPAATTSAMPEPAPPAVPSPTPAPVPIHSESSSSLDDVSSWSTSWPKLIEAINRRDVSLAGVLRDCKPVECENDRLVIGALYAFHLERLKDPAKLAVLEECVAELGGSKRKVEAIFSSNKQEESPANGADVTKAVLDTFSGSKITATRIREKGDRR